MSEFVPVPSPRELIESMVRAFVDSPSRVSVEEFSNQSVSILYLRVDAADLGKVIGKQGEMARALVLILQAATVKSKHQYTLLKIIDDLDVDCQQADRETVCALI